MGTDLELAEPVQLDALGRPAPQLLQRRRVILPGGKLADLRDEGLQLGPCGGQCG